MAIPRSCAKDQIFVVSDQPWLDYSALGNSMAIDELSNQLKE